MKSKIMVAIVAITMGSSAAYAAVEAVKACCCDKEMAKEQPAPAPHKM